MAMVLDAAGLMPSSSPSSIITHNSNVPCCSFSSSTFQARRNFSLLPAFSGLRISLPASSISPARRCTRAFSKITCEQPPMAPTQNVTTEAGVVSDKTWQQLVVESDIPVLVDFWAPWCGPCRMIAPLIDELARQYAGRFRCLKLNTDESPNTATEYGIRSIPTVMIFKGGEKKDTVIGAVPKATLISTMEKFIG